MLAEVVVLGTVGVLVDGAHRPVRSEKQALVLAHLALALGTPTSADVLADELWESPPSDPMHALQAHVSRLRQATGLPIVHTAGGYQLDPDLVTTDVGRFEQLLRDGERRGQHPESVVAMMREALGLWRGDVLENLPLSASLLAHRSRLDLLREQAVTRLADAHLAAEQPEAALPLLRDAVGANPLNERHWGQLMTALHRAGRRGEALATFVRAREELVDHLGLEPTVRLQQIHQEILQDGPTVDHRDQPGSDPLRSPELAGREEEWTVLTRLWREARTHQRVAVITGEPGIGKTYLASLFVRALGTGAVHGARCHADGGVPFEPVAQLIRSGCVGLSPPALAHRFTGDAAVLARLVPDVLTDPADPTPASAIPLDPQVERNQLQQGMIEWLRQITESGPVCLVIDDLQWSDTDSLRLLRALWDQSVELPVLWVVTLRLGESLHGSGPDLIASATTPSQTVVHVPLEGLGRAEVADLMRTALDDGSAVPHPDHPALDGMLTATAGNPLLVLEATRHLASRGDDTADALITGTVPPSLATIVESHLGRLPAPARELLDLAAVVGEDFDPLLVGLAADRGPQEVDEFLALGQHRRLLVPLGATPLRFRFRHALVHAVVLQQIPPLRRARLHLRVAAAVDDHPHLPDRLHLIARHHVGALGLVSADVVVPHLLAAATMSMEQRAPAAALTLYQQARDLLTPTSPPWQRCEVYVGLGEAGFRAGIDYRADLLEAARLASRAGDVDRLVRAAVANNRGWYSSIAEVDRDRVAVIETALAMLADDGDARHDPSRARILGLWAMENVRDPLRRKDALRRSEQALQIAEDLDDPALLGEILCHRYSVLYATFADPVGTFELAQRVDALANSRIDPELQLNSAIAVAQSAMTVGDFAVADSALDRSEQLASALSHPARMWLVRTWRAARTALSGDLAAAEAQAADALEMGLASEQLDAMAFFSGQIFAFHHISDRLPAILAAVEEQVAELDHIPAWQAAYAVALLSVDRRDEARAIVDRFHERNFEDLPLDVLYLSGLSYLAEAVAELDHADAAPALYDALVPYRGMVATNATIDSGPIDLALGRLATVCGQAPLARHHLADAEAWCRRVGAPLWLARVERARGALPTADD